MSQDPRLVEPRRVEDHPTTAAGAEAAYDPLRLCVYATVAPLGFVGYWRARRAGLLRSRCKLGDTRVVLVYLAALVAAGGTGIALGWWVW